METLIIHSQRRLRSVSPVAMRRRQVVTASLALICLAAAAVAGRAATTAIPNNDPRLAQIAERLGGIIAQGMAGAKPAPAAQAVAPAQQNAIQRLTRQTGEDLQVHLRPANQTVRQLRARSLAPAPKGAALQSVAGSRERVAKSFFNANRVLMRLADPESELALRQSSRDELGHQHLRFRQQYKDLPVWPGEVAAHFDGDGNMTLIEGAYAPTPRVDVLTPAVNADEAIARAKAAVAPTQDIAATKPELVIHAPMDGALRLAWKFDVTVSLTESWLMLVDAQDGSILEHSPRVCDAGVQGTGIDLFGETRTLHPWQNGGTFYLVDTSKGSYDPAFDPIANPRGVITVADANGASSGDAAQVSGIVSSSSANLWDIPAAVSAAYDFSETYDYYLLQLGRNSLDGNGGNITAIVQVGHYNNASWNGALKVMIFGDVEPYAGALDVVGHELTHGVTEHSSGLIYQNQSGALNEAFSDIFGEMVEARTKGKNDWLIGSELSAPIRNMKNPAAMFSPTIQRSYPSKMSEFAQLPNTAAGDNGGVHINSCIITHAFYLLAEGMTGAIGLRKAETIFYRANTQHLFAQSEFIDCRLACVASAEELYGKDGPEARATAQAFDAVEIYSAPTTPEPTPVPTVAGPDSVLFVNYDFWSGGFVLGRREAALNDSEFGSLLTPDVSLARPAVTGDGSIALVVSPDFDLCAVTTEVPGSRECLGYPGLVHSVAISPDARFAAFVLRDTVTGEADGKITLMDFVAQKVSTYNLVAPTADGVSVDTVLFADSMAFTTDGAALVYDALSQLKFGNGPTVQRWSIFSLRLDTGETSMLVRPQDGIDTGNPALGRAGNRYLVYDARGVASSDSTVTVMDLFTGATAAVGTAQEGWGYPTFLGDESGVVYSAPDPEAIVTGYSLVKQDLSDDRLHPKGNATLWYEDANLGVVYRRGIFQPTNGLPTVTLALSADQIPAQGTVTLTATASDSDGTVARVEFYDGSAQLGQVASAPYTIIWKNVPAGNHLVTARAVDNIGGAKDSSPRLLTVSGGGGANTPPTVSLKLSAGQIPAQGSVTLTATALDPDGFIARVEFYDGATKIGQINTAPYVFVWENVPAGNHLLKARAFDNAGGQTDSSVGFLTASGAPPVGDKPTLTIAPVSKDTVRLTVSGRAGYYIISMTEDFKTWVDIYPVTLEKDGSGSVDDSGGPMNSGRLFYRVYREP